MTFALAQTNPLIGDIDRNVQTILDFIHNARLAEAECVVFPELAVCGYPPKDLLLKESFIDANIAAIDRIARDANGGPDVLVGYVERNPAPVGRSVFNAVALLREGKVAGRFYKSLLPTYDVFDEHRYFEPAEHVSVAPVRANGDLQPAGITICEDLWTNQAGPRTLYKRRPVDELASAGAKLLINSSASPFVVGKQAFREQLMGAHAREKGMPLLMASQVGGNDDLLFDGASMAFDATGRLIARAKAFEEDLLIVNLDAPSRIEPYPEPLASVWQALVMGTRDYLRKCGFREVVLGLSGGIDSAVVAAIATEALGPDRVHGVAMPSRFSSDHSVRDAEDLARNLGIDLRIIPITRIHDMFEEQLTRHFDKRPPDVTEENLQARTRGAILMALSNKFGWLLLTTGNKSEVAVGYCTLYGDMCGGLAVISDVPKTMVYELARHANEKAGRAIIPMSTIMKPPSAELRPNQLDQDSLPPYDVLDSILQAYIEQEKSVDEIIRQGFHESIVRDVVRRVDRNEYKRQQMAPGLKVTSRAFGVGRRMPIAARFM